MFDLSILEIHLVVWVLSIAFLIHYYFMRQSSTVGLSLTYLFGLSLLHFFGALVHTFPENESPLTRFVQMGFEMSTYSIVAYCLGNTLIGGIYLYTFHGVRNPSRVVVDLKFPTRVLVIGLIFVVVLSPVFRNVPSIAAVAWVGIYLCVVGIVLGTWKGWFFGEMWEFRRYIVAAVFIPFMTLIFFGFLSFGVIALLIILVFVFHYYKPRRLAIVLMIAIAYMGISIFVNYSRERGEIRDAVWGGLELTERIMTLYPIITDFELFDPSNPRHVQAIDQRLNQNILVGIAHERLELGVVEYANGQTLWHGIIAAVPRIMWPDKPVVAGSGDVVSRFTGVVFAPGTSVGIGSVLEFLVNFGVYGNILGFMLLGLILRIFDTFSASNLYSGDWLRFLFWYLPGLGLLESGGSFVGIISTVAASFVLVIFLNKFVWPLWYQGGEVKI